jgi:oligopeptidase B
MVSKPFRPASLDWAFMSTDLPPEPPSAKQIPSQRTFHGDTVTDEYAWLAGKEDPDTIDYLRAENAYAEAATAGLDSLSDQIFDEIKARTQESDLSVPVRKGGWWHYSRTVEGKQYAVHCRRAVAADGEVIPPMAADGEPLDGEEVLLDGNELAAGHDFFSLGAFRSSPDQRWLAYSTDFAGQRAVHAQDQGPGLRARRCPTRSLTPTPAAPGRVTPPPVLRDRR